MKKYKLLLIIFCLTFLIGTSICLFCYEKFSLIDYNVIYYKDIYLSLSEKNDEDDRYILEGTIVNNSKKYYEDFYMCMVFTYKSKEYVIFPQNRSIDANSKTTINEALFFSSLRKESDGDFIGLVEGEDYQEKFDLTDLKIKDIYYSDYFVDYDWYNNASKMYKKDNIPTDTRFIPLYFIALVPLSSLIMEVFVIYSIIKENNRIHAKTIELKKKIKNRKKQK